MPCSHMPCHAMPDISGNLREIRPLPSLAQFPLSLPPSASLLMSSHSRAALPSPKPNPHCRPRLLFIGGLLSAHLVQGGHCGDSSPVKCFFSDVRLKRRRRWNGGGTAEFCVEANARLASPRPLVCQGRHQLCCQVQTTIRAHLAKSISSWLLTKSYSLEEFYDCQMIETK